MARKSKVAIVTGGTRGIGEAIVKTFVKDGYKVAFTYFASEKRAKTIEKETKNVQEGLNINNFAVEYPINEDWKPVTEYYIGLTGESQSHDYK